MSAHFDEELVEFTGWAETGEIVEIYKVGGGTLGKAYDGLWGYRVTMNDRPITTGADLRTGLPKTHEEAARLVLDLLHQQSDS